VPRLALVARWNDTVPMLDDNGQKIFHVPDSPDRLFEHWSPALDGAGGGRGPARM
jgi:hypothetical protein